jgi:hypothetical protein
LLITRFTTTPIASAATTRMPEMIAHSSADAPNSVCPCRARAKQGHTELGASALEWAIISGILVVAALAIGVVVKRVIDKHTADIDKG